MTNTIDLTPRLLAQRVSDFGARLKRYHNNPRTYAENEMDRGRWLARIDEDFEHNVQTVLLIILETCGTIFLDLYAAQTPEAWDGHTTHMKMARRYIISEIRRRCFAASPNTVNTSILFACERWTRGSEAPTWAYEMLALATGEKQPWIPSAASVRKTV